jgi:hypothetical protein
VNRNHATRDIQRPAVSVPAKRPILALDATHTNAYLRAAVGGVSSGPWAQVTVASLGFKGTTAPDRSVGATTQPDTMERRRSETQYHVSAGFTLGPARLEVADRLRALGGSTYNSVSGRLDLATSLGVLSGFVEHDGFRQLTTADAGIRFQPLPFMAVAGSVAQSSQTGSSASAPRSTAVRGEVGLKVFGPWVSVGMISTDKTEGVAPVVFDTLLLPTTAGRTTARTASIRGAIARGFGIDAWVARWNDIRTYQPEYQSRSEINYANNFRKRFPRGDLEIRAAAVYEYRAPTIFPLSAGNVRLAPAKTLSALLEVRIIRAVVSYQQRNILAYQYQSIPGFEMPRVLAIYGVRWEFWN